MSEFPRYKYNDSNGILYELGEHSLYYLLDFVRPYEKKYEFNVKANTKLAYMKEHQNDLFIQLVLEKKLQEHIDKYLDDLEAQTELILSKMEMQDEMGRLLAEEMARDNLL